MLLFYETVVVKRQKRECNSCIYRPIISFEILRRHASMVLEGQLCGCCLHFIRLTSHGPERYPLLLTLLRSHSPNKLRNHNPNIRFAWLVTVKIQHRPRKKYKNILGPKFKKMRQPLLIESCSSCNLIMRMRQNFSVREVEPQAVVH